MVLSLGTGRVSGPGVSAESEPPQARDLLAVELDRSDSLTPKARGQGCPDHVMDALGGVEIGLSRVVDNKLAKTLLQFLRGFNPVVQLLHKGNSKPDSTKKTIIQVSAV